MRVEVQRLEHLQLGMVAAFAPARLLRKPEEQPVGEVQPEEQPTGEVQVDGQLLVEAFAYWVVAEAHLQLKVVAGWLAEANAHGLVVEVAC